MKPNDSADAVKGWSEADAAAFEPLLRLHIDLIANHKHDCPSCGNSDEESAYIRGWNEARDDIEARLGRALGETRKRVAEVPARPAAQAPAPEGIDKGPLTPTGALAWALAESVFNVTGEEACEIIDHLDRIGFAVIENASHQAAMSGLLHRSEELQKEHQDAIALATVEAIKRAEAEEARDAALARASAAERAMRECSLILCETHAIGYSAREGCPLCQRDAAIRREGQVREAWIAARHVVFAAREVVGASPNPLPGSAMAKLLERVTAYDQRNHEAPEIGAPSSGIGWRRVTAPPAGAHPPGAADAGQEDTK